jgi:hypothetical protein
LHSKLKSNLTTSYKPLLLLASQLQSTGALFPQPSLTQLKTRDNAVHAGPSQPPPQLKVHSPSLTVPFTHYLNKTILHALSCKETWDAMVVCTTEPGTIPSLRDSCLNLHTHTHQAPPLSQDHVPTARLKERLRLQHTLQLELIQLQS